MGDADGKGTDPNQQHDEERARGEDPRLADIKEGANKSHQAEPVPYKVTGGK